MEGRLTDHFAHVAHGNLFCTGSLFLRWEAANAMVVDKVRRVIASTRRRVLRRHGWQTARHSKAALIDQALGGSLQDLAFHKCSVGEKRRMLGVLPEFRVVNLMHRRAAARTIEAFLRSWILRRKAARRAKGTHLVVRYRHIGPKGGFTTTERQIWDPSRLPLGTFFKLIKVYGISALAFHKESKLEEMLHALYCLWLINPAVLTTLLCTFLVGDIALPFLKNRVRSLLGHVIASIMLPRKKPAAQAPAKQTSAASDAGPVHEDPTEEAAAVAGPPPPVLGELTKETFDVVLVGTGVVESIVSAAAALVGRKVLHLDEHEYYGGDEATLTLQELEAEDAPKGSFRMLESKPWHGTAWQSIADGDARCMRSFNIDLNARLVLCRGVMVDSLVRSGVARYLEFKPLDETYMLDVDDHVLAVPCSKAAVFKSKDLSMMEKRQLMRFLQHALDAATVDGAGGETDAVRFRNEAHLNQGRSLARPQNKVDRGYDGVASGDMQQDFAAYLQEVCGLSPRLLNSIIYAVALEPQAQGVSVDAGMRRVKEYLGALGRFGSTAFLCPDYGTSEISQAFCRMSSVHGGIFVLRQRVLRTTVPAPQPSNTERLAEVHLASGEVVKARNVVVGPVAQRHTAASGLVEVRKLVILDGPVVSLVGASDGSEADRKSLGALIGASRCGGHHDPRERVFPELARCALVIPPQHSVASNPNPIHVVQLDSGVNAAAHGFFSVNLSSMFTSERDGQACLARTLDHLLQLANAKVAGLALDAARGMEKVWEVTVARPLTAGGDDADADACATERADPVVHVRPVAAGLATADFVREAQQVFGRVCPGEPFLPSEEDRAAVAAPAMATTSAGDADELMGFVSRVKVPQPADLRWFRWLGGKCQCEENTTYLTF
ncbi:Rab proteins geranylgeranyltransferase component A (Rab escort protein homolog) (REP) [Durusdinium trenchii]|uniref:Rab proteins geranylgeranyltransferase component A (Rab escort protein homolog) (REP) n=1 Tax=Durusdinium trenchii TaxID=1381693 RepID=A0ABP0IEW8_9DINO